MRVRTIKTHGNTHGNLRGRFTEKVIDQVYEVDDAEGERLIQLGVVENAEVEHPIRSVETAAKRKKQVKE